MKEVIDWAEKLKIRLGKEEKVEEKQNKVEVKKEVPKEEILEKKQSKKSDNSVEKHIKPSIYDKLVQNKQKKVSAARQVAIENEKKYQSNKSQSKEKKNLSQSRQKKKAAEIQKHPQISLIKNPQSNVPKKPPVNKSSPIKNKQSKPQVNLNYLNRYIPEDVKEKKIIDMEDQKRCEKIYIPDSDDEDEVKVKMEKRKTDPPQKNNQVLIIENAQKAVKDDELEEEFGITPSKKESLASVSFKQTKTINWDIQDDQLPKKQNKNLPSELPTVKTPSHMEPVTQVKVQEPVGDEIQIEQQIQDNQPYKSDEEESVQEEQLLIEDFEQKQVDFSKKIAENEKRNDELLKLKNHFEGEILKKMGKQKYLELKKKLTECSQEEVNEMVKVWNNIETINIFYRIVHFDNQISRCQQNISTIKNRLEEIKKNK